MEEGKSNPSVELQQFLRVYRIEPLGYILSRLPLPLIFSLFAVLYFGVLLILHNYIGTPPPPGFQDIFRHPSTIFYYPNLIGIAYDLIGNPLSFVLLVFFRGYIPAQFIQLEQDGYISRKSTEATTTKLARFVATNESAQTPFVIIIPLLLTFFGLTVDALIFLPQGLPAQYATYFLSTLGRYVRAAILVQLIYIFVILGNYRFNFRLHFNHPDECSGLSPFGKLAIAVYAYLFIYAMMQAIGTSAGGTAFERAIRSTGGSLAIAYLWIIFPLAFIFIFDQLVYKPHHALQKLQKQYLLNASQAWTNYHQQLTFSITREVEQAKTPLATKLNLHFDDDLELLENWARLNKYVEDMPTWPISRRTFRAVAVLANPLIPLLLPVLVEAVASILPQEQIHQLTRPLAACYLTLRYRGANFKKSWHLSRTAELHLNLNRNMPWLS